MWQMVIRNIWQRRLRSLLTILGIAAAVQVNLTVNGVISGYEDDIKGQMRALAGRVFVQRPTRDGFGMEEFPSAASSITDNLADALLNLEGIDASVSSAILYIPLASPPMSGLPPAVSAVGIELGHEMAFLGDLAIADGVGEMQDAHSVILGQDAAAHYGPTTDRPVKPGESIELLGQRFYVAGILESAPGLFDGMVMMDLGTAQALFERPGSVSAVILSVADAANVDPVRTAAEAMDSRLQTGSQEEITEAALEMMSITADYTGMINSVVVVVVFLFVMIVMIVAVMERRRDIGVLRAIGAPRRTIFGIVVSESLVLSASGVLLAWPIWGLIGAIFVGDYISPGEVILSAWLDMGMLALVVGVGASLIPAWRAVRVDPLEAMQYS
jgi:putative ABC transport system permease protein